MTSKGKKAGYGGKLANFIVCISYGKGVVFCQHYTKMNGPFFTSLITNDFGSIFHASGKVSRTFVQDGDPSQNCKAAKLALKHGKFTMQAIPARSPDINPIENVFHIAKRDLESDTIKRHVSRESYQEFVKRAQKVITRMSKTTIDNIIASMYKRMGDIVKNKGHRIKY